MYAGYFGLTENPFSITPDPRYLFLSTRHAEALAHLLYGITESGGFIQLTGEVGTGKTTLTRSLLDQLPDDVDVAVILNPRLSLQEFVRTICQELHVDCGADASLKTMIDSLNEHLLAAHSRGRRTVLIIDEAQNLSREILEQVRMLTNLETPKHKLLQIILIGQPELRDTLARQDLRQLAQRITGRYHLEPLTQQELSEYIQHRLDIAGAGGQIFTAAATKAVFRITRGIPRLVNIICDRALLGAYVEEQRQVAPDIVKRAATEVLGDGTDNKPNWPAYLIGAIASFTFAGIALWFALAQTDAPVTAAVPQQNPAVENVSEPTAAVVTEAAAPSLDQLLLAGQVNGGTDTAFQTLFAAWGESYEPVNSANACEFAGNAGLRCVYQRGTWNNLRQIDRPAIVTLTDSQGIEHHAVVTRLQDAAVELNFDGDTHSFPIYELDPLWYGEFLVFWRSPSFVTGSLQQGMRGEDVVWLREQLALAENETPPVPASDYFDDALAEQVRRFQQINRLRVDGIAGEQTLMRISVMNDTADAPRLTGD
ncbi:MAG: AAA family ATPase [Gammaproteobacteria bacterium]|nr:AAA family ATPase [Gammaproteobacteria bacterium]